MTGLVCITGGTGFIGSHVIYAALRAGYHIRLTIRKSDQAETIAKRYPEYGSKIETVLVPDLSKPEYFEDAFKDVDYIFHLASPMPGSGSDVRADYVVPAIQATEAVLYGALDFPNIQKIVLMSSGLSLMPANALFSKNATVKDNTGEKIPIDLDVEFPSDFTGHGLRYAASKIAAHQATRDFLLKVKPHYTLITFHPTFVLGHSMIQTSAENIDGINGLFWQSLFSTQPIVPAGGWVNVRDIADAHVRALENSIESGTEILLSGPRMSWDDALAFIKEKYPTLGCKLEPPFENGWDVDVSTADRLLKLKWRAPEEIIRDVVEQQSAFRSKS